MTMPTHEKEWFREIDKESYTHEFWWHNKFAWTVELPKSLLDQIRRDAKKELLDEIDSDFKYIAKEIDTKLKFNFVKSRYRTLRAKTLGENIK